MVDDSIDVAIVGGGIAGIYCAWRLKQDKPLSNIVVFESSDCVGGRLLSVTPPDIPQMVAELGGMRILPAVQPLITQLTSILNERLRPDQLIELYDLLADEPQNIAYLRGVYLRHSDFTMAPHKVPYHLSFLERGGTAGRIIQNAIEQIVPGITRPELVESQRRDMTRRACFDDVPLYKHGFWNVLLRVISGEAYQLSADAGGYNSTLTNWNAADAIPWYLSDFAVAPKYKGFRKGFQHVPKMMARLFEAEGGYIRRSTPVDSFDCVGDGFVLRIGQQRVHASSLILALPRRSLELLAPESPPLQNSEIRELIESVTPRPLLKLFTTYSSPWWRAAGYTNADGSFIPVEAGRSVTDLPVRQTYYWPRNDGTPATQGPSMLMASYDDGANIGFWDGLRPRRRHPEDGARPDEWFRGDCAESDASAWCKNLAPRRMVAEVARQLALIHGLPYTPIVRNAAFRDWGVDPFGGGWNSWNIGVESWKVKDKIVQPMAPHALYICGESYSDAQGWVEGALQTAEEVLKRLGLPALADI